METKKVKKIKNALIEIMDNSRRKSIKKQKILELIDIRNGNINKLLKKESYRNTNEINYIAAKHMLEDGNTILVDVRSRLEYKEGHLKGAVNIPLEEVEVASNTLLNPANTIILYCKSGLRSKKAIDKLERMGYKHLYSIKGGYDNI